MSGVAYWFGEDKFELVARQLFFLDWNFIRQASTYYQIVVFPKLSREASHDFEACAVHKPPFAKLIGEIKLHWFSEGIGGNLCRNSIDARSVMSCDQQTIPTNGHKIAVAPILRNNRIISRVIGSHPQLVIPAPVQSPPVPLFEIPIPKLNAVPTTQSESKLDIFRYVFDLLRCVSHVDMANRAKAIQYCADRSTCWNTIRDWGMHCGCASISSTTMSSTRRTLREEHLYSSMSLKYYYSLP
jgi:hypothetical protein